MKLGYAVNEFGIVMGVVYRCAQCEVTYTVCPVPEDDTQWHSCRGPLCTSYVKERDADRLVEDEDGDEMLVKERRVLQ